ncbi:hypothetical protein EMCG_03223, partial [[Emmonsia] crescens]
LRRELTVLLLIQINLHFKISHFLICCLRFYFSDKQIDMLRKQNCLLNVLNH